MRSQNKLLIKEMLTYRGITPVKSGLIDKNRPVRMKGLGATNVDLIEKDDHNLTKTKKVRERIKEVKASTSQKLVTSYHCCRVTDLPLTKYNAVHVTLDNGKKYILTKTGLHNLLLRNSKFHVDLNRESLLHEKTIFESVTDENYEWEKCSLPMLGSALMYCIHYQDYEAGGVTDLPSWNQAEQG